jgi:hypothetical protein
MERSSIWEPHLLWLGHSAERMPKSRGLRVNAFAFDLRMPAFGILKLTA